MKVRRGFVSNSSSSSFIITAKKGLTEEEFEEAVDNFPWAQSDEKITPAQFRETYIYRAVVEAIHNGQIVLIGSCGGYSEIGDKKYDLGYECSDLSNCMEEQNEG